MLEEDTSLVPLDEPVITEEDSTEDVGLDVDIEEDTISE